MFISFCLLVCLYCIHGSDTLLMPRPLADILDRCTVRSRKEEKKKADDPFCYVPRSSGAFFFFFFISPSLPPTPPPTQFSNYGVV